jgi:feruloyl esterase
MKSRAIFSGTVLTLWLMPLGMAHAQTVGLEQSCRRLADLVLPDTRITVAEVVAEKGFTPPGEGNSLQLPAFCRLAGTTSPAVNFEVWLPLEGWNGKFQVVGNGGMAGTLSYPAMASALQRNYATASTDTGHAAGPVAFDASWAAGRPDLIEDFGHRSLHLTTVNGKQVVAALYASPPEYSYYVGCSKGGQQGLMEAQRYPQDFDGIIAGDPANDWTRFYAGAHLWYSLAMLEDSQAWIPPAKLPALENAVNNACDAQDGIEDGILMNPLACQVDLSTLTCPAGTDDNACLTPRQVSAVEKIWSGVSNSAGELVYPGLVPGGEAAAGGWSTWVTGSEPFRSLHWLGGEGFFRWFVFDDPDWDFTTFDFDADLEYALRKVGPAVDAVDPDLTTLRDNGAKLIVYHGWSDPDISPVASINYYNQVVDFIATGLGAGARAQALESTRDFFRLFMVPGMAHCRGGPGPDQFDALTALENWVEKGIAPQSIIAAKIEAGETTRSRPLCPYPEVAIYDGSGSTDLAENFYCANPD